MKIAIVGAGISGLAAASILNKAGHTTVVFEKSSDIGGVWAVGYPEVGLQNTYHQYALSQFPWPFTPSTHPTASQIMRYLHMAVESLRLDVRFNHPVTEVVDSGDGWEVRYSNPEGTHQEHFDFLISAVGQYTEGKYRPEFPGMEKFQGEIITEREVEDLETFRDKRTVIVGFGKSALDMSSMAVRYASQVYHVFRTPRWMIPFQLFGIHYSKLLFSRIATFFIPCWVQPTRFERFLHTYMKPLVTLNWAGLTAYVKASIRWRGWFRGKAARERLACIIPKHSFVSDMRSASALRPEAYVPAVATGEIEPHHAALSEFDEKGVLLTDGQHIDCDLVLLCTGSETPTFPFFPDKYRAILERDDDGLQLYRHVIHPDIPNCAFAGYNHGFMHVPAAEIGMVWLCAVLDKSLTLPSRETMLASIEAVQEWKRENINYEPSRSCAVNTRFQQYIDSMLNELGFSPYRKMPNVLAEAFQRYGSTDYVAVIDEYLQQKELNQPPRPVLTGDI